MTTQIYQVPVVSNGLRETESILQIVDSLEKLEKVFNDMYSTISARVSHEKSRIDNVASRLNNAQHKVNQIVGSKQAITVFSSARYPADKKWGDYVPIYCGKKQQPFKPSHFHLNSDEQIKKRPEDSYLDVNDLVFIEKSIDTTSKEIEVKEGLGRIPAHLPSVSNLLLFNTQENPYKKYSNTLDNLSGADGDPDQFQIFGDASKKKKKLHAAPVTIEKGDIRPEAENVKINYEPGTFEIPVYNFPSILPLPNVAENITWAAESQSIAPSQKATLNLLPTYDNNNNTSGGSAPSTVNTDQVPPPPTPQQQQPQYQQAAAAPQQPQYQQAVSAPPPPPPQQQQQQQAPPPPPFKPQNNNDDDDDDSDDDNGGGGGGGGAIGDLLADIRRGHKNRLKKSKTKGEDGEDGEEGEEDDRPPPKKGGGDMMSDLFKKLALRRQSIATSKPTKKQSKSKKDSDLDQDGESDTDDSEWEP